MQTIASLRVGESAIIAQESLDQIPLQLLEMGCYPGATVTLVRVAPLNDPIYVCINDSHLAIRVSTAKKIRITQNDE